MKQLTLAILVVLISLALINCGAEKLTPAKAKETIDKEVDGLVQKAVETQKGEISEEDMKKMNEKVSEIKQAIKVMEIKQEEKDFIAKVEITAWKEPVNVEMKFSKGDDGWQIDAVKLPEVQWMTRKEVIEKIDAQLAAASKMGKIKATMGDMKFIGTAIESYITDNYKAPEVGSFVELKEILEPFYVRTLPLTDAWGNPFHYYHGTGETQDAYAVGSGGSDGKFEGFEQKGTYTDTEGKDIIFSSGEFTFAPEIK